jgi:hypothetical protein
MTRVLSRISLSGASCKVTILRPKRVNAQEETDVRVRPPARDPAFAAVARARAAEQAFAVGNPDGLAEARAALAATIATTLPGLAAITGFVREMARELGDAYFVGDEGVRYAASLDATVRALAGLPPRA